MNPEHAAAARQAARDAGKQVGQWLEEAITEKQEREKEAGNVTKVDWLRNWGSARPISLTCSTVRGRGERIYTSVTWELLTLLLTVKMMVLTTKQKDRHN